MHVLVGIAGFAIILIILGDAFETIILPRRVTRKIRLTRLFYRNTWLPWRALATRVRDRKLRESLLSLFGPMSLLMLLVLWAVAMIVAFAMLQWACGSKLYAHDMPPGFGMDLYVSGTNFSTLGIGDIIPRSGMARFLTALEAATGFGFLALVIGYLPVIYQAFSRRESHISLLDARAGSPPAATELIRRYAESRALNEIEPLLLEWEHWAAELLESHISYPVLALFRSQHSNESWVGALTSILDTSALLIVGVETAPARQAQLTFAMARHAVVDLAQVLQTPPLRPEPDRLPAEALVRLRNMLRQYRVPLRDGIAAGEKLSELRRMYEPYVNALADYLMVSLPSWFPSERTPDNWQTSAWERAAKRIPPADAFDPGLDDHY
ncbi:MAG: potassium channel family protein [Terriglobales bacterium]